MNSMILTADSVENHVVKKLKLTSISDDPKKSMSLTAEEAIIKADIPGRKIDMHMTNVVVSTKYATGVFRSNNSYPLPIEELVRLEGSHRPPQMRREELKEYEQELIDSIRNNQQKIASESALSMISGEFSLLGGKQWSRLRQEITHNQSALRRVQMEPFRRISMALTCFCFVFIGAPWALWRGKSEIMTNFFVCGMPIFLIFVFSFMASLNLGKQGVLPPWMLLSGNILLLVLGSLIMKKAAR